MPVSPSMESVARAAGVAASTVSRALRGDPRISAVTSEHIRNMAERLGYRPNPLVAALMAQLRGSHPPNAKCNLIWLDFYPHPDDFQRYPVQQAFFAGACQRAKAMGYAISRIPAAGRSATQLVRTLRNRGVRGVLLPHFADSGGLAARIPLPLGEFTIVCVGTRFEQPALHYSSEDQYECGRLAVQQLWAMGYRRIGYVGEPRVEQIVNGRFFAGYHAALQTELGGAPLPLLLTDRDDEVADWIRRMGADALVTSKRSLLKQLRRQGVRVPGDVALAHLNLDDVEDALPGEVAGVKQDNAGVGANAVELLVSALYHNEIGVPLHPRGLQVRGTWVPGATLTPAPVSRRPA